MRPAPRRRKTDRPKTKRPSSANRGKVWETTGNSGSSATDKERHHTESSQQSGAWLGNDIEKEVVRNHSTGCRAPSDARSNCSDRGGYRMGVVPEGTPCGRARGRKIACEIRGTGNQCSSRIEPLNQYKGSRNRRVIPRAIVEGVCVTSSNHGSIYCGGFPKSTVAPCVGEADGSYIVLVRGCSDKGAWASRGDSRNPAGGGGVGANIRMIGICRGLEVRIGEQEVSS